MKYKVTFCRWPLRGPRIIVHSGTVEAPSLKEALFEYALRDHLWYWTFSAMGARAALLVSPCHPPTPPGLLSWYAATIDDDPVPSPCGPS